MERENQRKYPIFEQLSTEELEKLLAQDFAATGEEEPDVDYIMAIMGVINEREKAAGRQVDVDAAWKDFQEEYQGQAAAFDRTIQCEAESSDHQQVRPAHSPKKKTRVFRYMVIAAAIVVLLCGTATGFGRVFQAMVNWSVETFGFASPYDKNSVAAEEVEDPYADLRATVAEYTDLLVIPRWSPEGTIKTPDTNVKTTERKDMTIISGNYQMGDAEFSIHVRIHSEIPPQYVISYQWDENQSVVSHNTNDIEHKIVGNYENSVAVWTNENTECMIQGQLNKDELIRMIDSIYEEYVL